MPDAGILITFCSATVLLLLVPGPAVLYVVTQTARLGLGRGLVGALGVECGTLTHATAATVGLSALLARSETAFTVVKYAGVAYLLVLGWRQLRAAGRAQLDGAGGPSSLIAESAWKSFRTGFVVELLNPKTALFFLAFLPQFVDPGAANRTAQLGLLGALFVAMALVVDGTYAVTTALVRRRARGAGHRWDRAGGIVLWGLAAVAAAS